MRKDYPSWHQFSGYKSDKLAILFFFLYVLKNICTAGLEIRILGQFEKVFTSPENHKPETTLELKFGLSWSIWRTWLNPRLNLTSVQPLPHPSVKNNSADHCSRWTPESGALPQVYLLLGSSSRHSSFLSHASSPCSKIPVYITEQAGDKRTAVGYLHS